MRASHRIPVFVFLCGLAVLVFAFAADTLGIGSRPGIGRFQIMCALLGVAGMGAGAALRTTSGQRLVRSLVDRSPGRLAGRDVAVVVVGFALVGGLADSALLHLQNALGQGFDFIPRGHVWMSSVSFLVLLLVPALAAWLLGRFVLEFFGSERLIVGGLTFILVAGVASNYYPELPVWAILIFSAGVAAQAWRSAVEHHGRLVRVSRRALGPLAVLVIALAAASGLEPRLAERKGVSGLPDSTPGARNILLIILDTVRARNMSLHGYERATTPYLESIAESSVVFDRAYAPSSWTLPSHASIFTGLDSHHLSANWITPLGGEPPTLAEVFASRGYLTGGFSANQNYTGPHTGLDRGFLRYDAGYLHPRTVLGASMLGRLVLLGGWEFWSWDKIERKPGSAVTDQFLEWVPDSTGRPFFAFLNYYDAHDPYDPPASFADHFAGDVPPVRPVHGPRRPRLQSSIRAYDEAIAYIDAQLRRLMSELARRGQLDNTVIVVTADHGEEFAEKGQMNHGNNLNASVLHVPLLVVLPDRSEGIRLQRPVSLSDLAVTLLELSRSGDEETPPLPGRSFATELRGPAALTRRSGGDTVLSELTGFRAPGSGPPRFEGYLVSAITSSLHYVVDQAGQEDLFVLDADWWEQESVAGQADYREELRRFREWVRPALRAWAPRTVPPPEGTPTFPGRRIEGSDPTATPGGGQ